MRIALVTDAWRPQVNGVVRTLTETKRELEAAGHTVEMIAPERFTTFPCPTYPEIRLSLAGSGSVGRLVDAFAPDAVHIATEGPLGWAARAACLARRLPFTTAYHTRFPEYVQARVGAPLSWSYAVLRRFHSPASRVMVPTQTVKTDLETWGFRNVVLWTRGVDLELFRPGPRDRLATKPPIFVYVGRVAVEKNVEAFLALDLPGSKWVVGEGPAMAALKTRYPEASYLGVLQQKELAAVYSAADVFVFPSKTDTFGLVLLEAMACGTPVAAYPVTGPLDVLGDVPAAVAGGAMDGDLRVACLKALEIPRVLARAHAERYSWAECARQFAEHLRPREG
ncbi:MAG: glycosyltransferase family 1 protein [Proteobacteria bacterium]|nr:glycosyltransferase family 1 protein [Pseudomonadota bacterium]